MKRHWMLAFLIAGALVISTVAQDVNAQSTNAVVTQQQGSSDHGEHTIVVDVWSKSELAGPEPAKVSSAFAAAGLNAAFKMELTERKIENSIRRGFPLGEFWIQNDLAEVDDALKLTALSVVNDADQQALQELEKQSTRLRTWSDWLIDQNRHLALTEYYISSSTLDDDEQFQNSVACTKFLVSMLSSRTLAQANSCL
ncbi:MAG TPA: hypothetical protein VKG65_00770 [Terriglobales bacterium]|nr:hypothetical protein [Terriglobales bacterium]